VKKWKLVKDDDYHWHYTQGKLSEKLEHLECYDIQLTLVFNPLNWTIGRFTDYSGVREISFGPIRLMIYHG